MAAVDGENPTAMPIEDAIRMQDDLIKGYYSEDFQRKVWAELLNVTDDMKLLQGKVALNELVQFEVLPKYGFTADRKGVQASMKVFTPEMNAHPVVTEKNLLMQYLIDPNQQKRIAESGVGAPKGVLKSRIRNPHPDDWPEEGGKAWLVIGGKSAGGIKVRRDEDVKSVELKDRLATGSLIEEVARVGSERLKYELMSGSGPEIGWIAMSFKGAPLLQPLWQDEEFVVDADAAVAYKVVHDRVAKRSEPSKDAKMVGAAVKGERVKGAVVDVDGVQWLKIRDKAVGTNDMTEMYMMIDGKSVGLGELLKKC